MKQTLMNAPLPFTDTLFELLTLRDASRTGYKKHLPTCSLSIREDYYYWGFSVGEDGI